MSLLSQRRVDQVVDVAPERIWVHLRKILATTNEFGRASAGSRQGAELSHRRTVASNDEAFAVLDAAQDFSPIIPEIAHRHRVHVASVSPVRQSREGRTSAARLPAPTALGDIIAAVCEGYPDDRVTRPFYQPLREVSAVENRHEVFRELECGNVRQSITAPLRPMTSLSARKPRTAFGSPRPGVSKKS